LVVAISQRRKVVTLYQGNITFRLREIEPILIKANQALQTLEKYRNVLFKELQRLGGLEFEDMVTVSEVCEVLKRGVRVLNIAKEIENYIAELGTEGRLGFFSPARALLTARATALTASSWPTSL
jgi:diadenylate cyclase